MKSSLSAGERYGVPFLFVNANGTSIPLTYRSRSSGSTRSATHLRHTQQRRAMTCRFVPYIARSLRASGRSRKKKSRQNQAAVVACEDFVFPRHIESVVPDSRHLKGWFSL